MLTPEDGRVPVPERNQCQPKHLWIKQRNHTALSFLPQAGLSFAEQEQADVGPLQV